MKKILFITVCSTALIFASCSKSNCKECTGCDNLPSATLCEDDFEKTSDFNDQVDNYVSNGCECKDK